MGCGDITKRQPFQELLAELNPSMAAYVARLPPDSARTGQLDRDMPEAVRPRLFSFCGVLVGPGPAEHTLRSAHALLSSCTCDFTVSCAIAIISEPAHRTLRAGAYVSASEQGSSKLERPDRAWSCRTGRWSCRAGCTHGSTCKLHTAQALRSTHVPDRMHHPCTGPRQAAAARRRCRTPRRAAGAARWAAAAARRRRRAQRRRQELPGAALP